MADHVRWTFGDGPAPEVIRYFKEKQLTPSFDWRDVWAEEHAIAFTVARSAGFDVLEDIHEELSRAIEEGLPFAEFRKRLEPRLRTKGWWGRREVIDPASGEVVEAQLGSRRRLKVIYEANMRTARAAGQWERAQRTKRMLPYFAYRLGPSRQHRAQHAAWASAPTILPVDDPFWNTHYPPNGWGCKCWLRQVSRREAQRLGGPTESPQIQYRNWINRRTGRMEKIPVGIDPGWHSNPGKARARLRAARQHMAEKLSALPEPWGRAAIAANVKSNVFQELARGKLPDGFIMPLAWLPAVIRQEMQAETNVVLLSSETAKKQVRSHPDVFKSDAVSPEETYALVQEMLDAPDIILQDDDTHYGVLKNIEGRGWRISLKKTSKKEIFITNMHRLRKKTMRQALKKAARIIRQK